MYIMLSQTALETLSACAASKVLAAVLTYPCQTVRACQQAQTATGVVAANPTTVGSILKSQGVRGYSILSNHFLILEKLTFQPLICQ